jgi:uncharacterized protein
MLPGNGSLRVGRYNKRRKPIRTGFSNMMPCSALLDRARWILLAAVAAVGICAGHAARAATFPDLFTVTVVPEPRTLDGRTQAQRRAEIERLGMAQLLTRITGRRDAASQPELMALIQRAGTYVISFGALDRERTSVGFNSTRITNELASLNWPIWSAERPLTLLWVAVDFGDGQRALIGDTLNAAELTPEFATLLLDVREELDTVARERGLPIRYPLLDPQDLAAISFAEIWGGFDGLIEAASQRYVADAVLIGRLGMSPLGLDVRWSLLEVGRSQAVFGTDVRGGLEWLADRYAAEFSIAGGARSALVTVLDVASVEDYGRVVSYLESLSVLQSVDVESFDGDTLNLRIAARGDDRVVARLLTLGGVLVPSSAGIPGASSAGSGLVFRMAGSRVER